MQIDKSTKTKECLVGNLLALEDNRRCRHEENFTESTYDKYRGRYHSRSKYLLPCVNNRASTIYRLSSLYNDEYGTVLQNAMYCYQVAFMKNAFIQ